MKACLEGVSWRRVQSPYLWWQFSLLCVFSFAYKYKVVSDALQMEERTQAAMEDARMAREELSANQHVLKMLHNKMDLLLQEIHTLSVYCVSTETSPYLPVLVAYFPFILDAVFHEETGFCMLVAVYCWSLIIFCLVNPGQICLSLSVKILLQLIMYYESFLNCI